MSNDDKSMSDVAKSLLAYPLYVAFMKACFTNLTARPRPSSMLVVEFTVTVQFYYLQVLPCTQKSDSISEFKE
jgi:hypothetical protein